MSTAADRDRLVDVLAPTLEASGLDLEEVEITPAGRRRLLRVVVDKDGGVTLDEIADATAAVSRRLDETDVMDDASYTLEVTSPGVDRPLTLPRHWRRNVGRLVKVTTPDESFTGRLSHAGDSAATLDVDSRTREVAYRDVANARVEIEFNRRED